MAPIATSSCFNPISCLGWSILILTLFDPSISADGILPLHPPRSLRNLCGPRHNDARDDFLCMDIFRLLRTSVSRLTFVCDWIWQRDRSGRRAFLLQDLDG